MDIVSSESKKNLRKTILKQRLELNPNQTAKWDEDIQKKLFGLKELNSFKSISCFVGSREKAEINTLPVIQKMIQNNFEVCVPVMSPGTQLNMIQIEHTASLRPNSFGILEPKDNKKIVLNPDLCVIPLLASDFQKNRLGYGAGYYDRYLSKHPDVFTVGLVYQCFIFEKLPIESHDIPLDIIITEETVLK